MSNLDIDSILRDILVSVLGLSASRVATFSQDTGLFGSLPEVDSMSIAFLLTDIEDRYNILVEDVDLDADVFGTYGALLDMIADKLGAFSERGQSRL